MTNAYDAVVIGSGHNGLTCACYLAKADMKVLVLEQYPSTGGMTNTEEVAFPGFFSDIHAFGYQLANVSPVPAELDLPRFGFELIHPEVSYAQVFDDGTAVSAFRDIECTIESIGRRSRRDAEAYRALCAQFSDGIESFAAAINSPPLSPAEQLSALANKKDGIETYRFQLQSFRSWAREVFEAEQTKVLLGTWCSHIGLSPDDAGGASGAVGFAALIQRCGNNLVKGGMVNLPVALAGFLRAYGGEVRTNAGVEKIVVERGRAIAVRLANGEEIDVAGLVASSVDPQQLGLRLLGEDVIGSSLARMLRRYDVGESALVIYLALDRPVHYKSGEDPGRSVYVHPVPSIDFLSRQFQECRGGLLPSRPFALLCNDSACDPSRAPKGKALMKLVVQPVPYIIAGDASGTIRGRDWSRVKEQYADRVIEQVTTDYIPDLSENILRRAVLSPVDLEKRLSSAVRGTMMHGAVSLYQTGAMRPIPGMGRYKSPVDNVYLCGSGSHPGGGVSMAPGRNAAREIYRDMALTFPA
ncbi:MAG: NAD(P)/FAD-dependent oxidoreductase [Rhodobacteraceae bacterium]|nr:NAD(P)/FAD-dependent oxidoreductase [Paracoccaceae bacterium]HRX75554.1 NAD(P)/FAD-dependent oxidoreductase [Hyphomonas sp.]